MIFAIDYDGTYSAAPASMEAVARLLHGFGHKVIMVTQRAAEQSGTMELAEDTILTVIYASGYAKRLAALDAGYDVDVWMDDNPMSVDQPLVYRRT